MDCSADKEQEQHEATHVFELSDHKFEPIKTAATVAQGENAVKIVAGDAFRSLTSLLRIELERAKTPHYFCPLVNNSSDTIAAIATAPGEAGIAIVRVSGPQSLEVADNVFECNGPRPSQRPGGSFAHGFIIEESPVAGEASRRIDEVILLVYRAPHSYTREDVVEIQCHGGRISVKRILRAVVNAGARLAEPGEFTKRAFLNGRIDLVQAEAVADLIKAQSDRAAEAAMEQLGGSLSAEIRRSYDAILNVASKIEAMLDFPEDELPVGIGRGIAGSLDVVAKDLGRLRDGWEEGRLLREGALVVISGRPNAGKSTLLNKLLGIERAIVSDTPGTTRDTIEEQFLLEGAPLRLVDTAGLRESDCAIEREGVRRARALMARADLNLHVIDASRPLDLTDGQYVCSVNPGKCVLILNKADLGARVAVRDFHGFAAVSCSMVSSEGLDSVKRAIAEKLNLRGGRQPTAAISERHRHCIQNALNELNHALRIIRAAKVQETIFAAQHVRASLESLGSVLGTTCDNDLLTRIFGNFCIGK